MISYPFESQNTGTAEAPVYDRAITAEQERLFNKLRYVTGVFSSPANSLQVEAAGGMAVKVNPGGCHIEGAIGYQEEALTFALTAGGSKARIDRVVARLNTTLPVRDIEIVVLEGTAATSPKAPTLTREPNYYEIALADIYIEAGVSSVGNRNITDQRGNADLCGFVVPAIPTPLDLSALYKQYQDALSEYLDTVASAIDGTLAGNLQNQINTFGVNNIVAVHEKKTANGNSFTEVYANGKFKFTHTFYSYPIGPFTEKYTQDGGIFARGPEDEIGGDTHWHYFPQARMFEDMRIDVDQNRLEDLTVSVHLCNQSGFSVPFSCNEGVHQEIFEGWLSVEVYHSIFSAVRTDQQETCRMTITIEGYWEGDDPNFWTIQDGNEVEY